MSKVTYGEPNHWIGDDGRLWCGRTNPEINLHYSTFEGFALDGSEIWILRRSDAPDGVLIAPETARAFIERWAAAIRAAEQAAMERCAQIAERWPDTVHSLRGWTADQAAESIATAIRAQAQEGR